MKNRILLSIFALACVAAAGSARAEDPASAVAARNAALLASGQPVRLCPVVYYYGGTRYYHRRVVGYKTYRIVSASGYVRYKRVPVYYYW